MKKIKNRNYLIAIGTLSLVISISLGRLVMEFAFLSFFEGLFMGISLATNLSYLILYSLEKGTLSYMRNRCEEE